MKLKEYKKQLLQLVLVGSIGMLLFGYTFVSAQKARPTVEATAQRIVAECGAVAGDHTECYESKVPALYPAMALSDIFNVVRAVRTLDPSYQFCHVLAHKIGTRVVAEDPSKWLDAIPQNPTDGLCSNGFIHGVIVGRFSSATLDDATINKYLPDFAIACEPRESWHPSRLDQAMCYHGMGHLFDFITSADLPKALSLCNRVANSPTGDYRQVCVEGVFMQIYQPLEPDDFALIRHLQVKPTAQNVRSFCASFKDPQFVGACLRESWPFFKDAILQGTGAEAFCSGQPDASQTSRCYESISSIVGRQTLGSVDKTILACNNFPAAQQSTCYSASAGAILEEGRGDATAAIALCKAGEPVIGQTCIQDLVQRSQFIFGAHSKDRDAFCKLVPSSLKTICITETH